MLPKESLIEQIKKTIRKLIKFFAQSSKKLPLYKSEGENNDLTSYSSLTTEYPSTKL